MPLSKPFPSWSKYPLYYSITVSPNGNVGIDCEINRPRRSMPRRWLRYGRRLVADGRHTNYRTNRSIAPNHQHTSNNIKHHLRIARSHLDKRELDPHPHITSFLTSHIVHVTNYLHQLVSYSIQTIQVQRWSTSNKIPPPHPISIRDLFSLHQ